MGDLVRKQLRKKYFTVIYKKEFGKRFFVTSLNHSVKMATETCFNLGSSITRSLLVINKRCKRNSRIMEALCIGISMLPSQSTKDWMTWRVEIYLCIVLEARSHRSRWRQGWVLWRITEKDLFQAHPFDPTLCSHIQFPLCVPVSEFLFLVKTQVILGQGSL